MDRWERWIHRLWDVLDADHLGIFLCGRSFVACNRVMSYLHQTMVPIEPILHRVLRILEVGSYPISSQKLPLQV